MVAGPDEISPPDDPDLARVVAAWPTLPDAVKAGVLAMVRASGRCRVRGAADELGGGGGGPSRPVRLPPPPGSPTLYPSAAAMSRKPAMLPLSDLRPGLTIRGVLPDAAVTVIGVQPFGEGAVEVTFKDADGRTGQELLYADREADLHAVESGGPWSFDANPEEFRLAAEARRIHLAWLFDPLLAVHCSLIEPLPHQITAVYGDLLPRQPLRFVLADDPGAGKTIMAGLYIRELMARGDLRRCLIVSPGSLVEQWQDELSRKFDLPFDILTNDALEAARSGNWFLEHPLAIARLDKLARDEAVHAKLDRTDWDLVVFDESHKLSASYFGNELKRTKRYRLAERLGPLARHLLLLTATPHNGKEDDFRLFLKLLDADRFEGRGRGDDGRADPTDLMRRLVKEELKRLDGSPLFPPRRSHTVGFDLTDAEADLYDRVTDYVRREFNRAEAAASGKRGTVGFALTVLQRRLASSPAAISKSLTRRRERLEARLAEAEEAERTGRLPADTSLAGLPGFDEAPDDGDLDRFDLDDLPGDEAEALEELIVDRASAARTAVELREEIVTLRDLEAIAGTVAASRTDRKWEELRRLIQENPEMTHPDGRRRKLVVFTEHRDTLDELAARVRTVLGRAEAVVTIDGGVRREDRLAAQERFNHDPTAVVLVATDAAGEGINLQHAAHLMVNYDLPWNPNRLEQRFGRIHRIGQTEVCHLWNLVANKTREGEVYARLLQKLETARGDLNGRVFDILGRFTFGEKSLRDFMIEVVRRDRTELPDEEIDRTVDDALSPARVEALLRDHALADDRLDAARVREVRETMERADARRLQPFHVSAFFREAFTRLGGQIRSREPRRYEIPHVPAAVRERTRSGGTPVAPRYDRVTFHRGETLPRAGRTGGGGSPAEMLCPGHPLLDAVLDLTRESLAETPRRGTVFVDESDPGTVPHVLVFLEHAIRDGLTDHTGERRVISRRVLFVELRPDGTTRDAGPAPYLDYRAATADERTAALDRPEVRAAVEDVERRAVRHAVDTLVREHLDEVKHRREDRVKRTKAAVQKRLTTEIAYWSHRSAVLEERAAAGKPKAAGPAKQARDRAEELIGRRESRLAELELERRLAPQPPVVAAGALVIPAGLLAAATGRPLPVIDTRTSELAAMRAVFEAERSLGFEPRDVSDRKGLGYDIESHDPATGGLRFLEVKARRPGAETVTVTKSEVSAGLNSPANWFLVLVEVTDGVAAAPRYVSDPFDRELGLNEVSSNFHLKSLWEKAVPPAETVVP